MGEKHSKRYPDYHRWDISLVRRRPWLEGRGSREFYVQVVNATNHMNILQYFYSEDWEYYEDWDAYNGGSAGIRRRAIPMFPFFPTIGWRFAF